MSGTGKRQNGSRRRIGQHPAGDAKDAKRKEDIKQDEDGASTVKSPSSKTSSYHTSRHLRSGKEWIPILESLVINVREALGKVQGNKEEVTMKKKEIVRDSTSELKDKIQESFLSQLARYLH